MKPKIFYGWFIVAACMLIAAAGIGFHNTASIFVRPVTEDLGLSRGEFIFYRTIIVMISAGLLPLYGKLAKRFKIKHIMLAGTIGGALSLIGYSFAWQLWHFYGLAVINGLFANAAHFMLIGILINRWFEDKRGLALGIAFAGSGLGAAMMVPLASQIIALADWRWGFRFSGVAALIVLIPTIIFLIKEHPEDKGIAPYKTNSSDKPPVAPDRIPKGLMLSQARKTPTFWILAVAFLCISISAGAPNAHTAPYLGDLGYASVFYSAVISFSLVVLTVGKIFMGHVFDRFGLIVGGAVLGISLILSPIFALLSANPVAPWFYAFFLGLGSTGFSIAVNIYAMQFFGERDFTAILSVLSMITAFGAAFAAPAVGFVYDFLGNYTVAWVTLAGLGFVATFCLIAVNFIRERLIDGT